MADDKHWAMEASGNFQRVTENTLAGGPSANDLGSGCKFSVFHRENGQQAKKLGDSALKRRDPSSSHEILDRGDVDEHIRVLRGVIGDGCALGGR